MCLSQVTLDVELWVNRALHAELAKRGMAYHSLTDYDLQLAEVQSVVRCTCTFAMCDKHTTPPSVTK